MPDEWEQRHGLNPRDASDAGRHDMDKDYTNVEVYMNGLVAVP